jgi:hypothetical protein
MAGYHIREIKKGIVGEFSKISEEFLEFEDAVEQASVVMALVELSDLIGAIEAFFAKKQKQNFFNELIDKVKNNTNNHVTDYFSLKESFSILSQSVQVDDYSNFEKFFNDLDSYIKHYNLTINDLYTMSQITKRVFLNGYR